MQSHLYQQNDTKLINACGEEILSIILKRVQKSGVYSIMFDETTNVSHQSQLTLILRYVHEGNIREDFIQFMNPRDDHHVNEDEDTTLESTSQNLQSMAYI